MKLRINKIEQDWYWGILQGFSNILDGLVLVLTLGLYSMNLTLMCAVRGARAGHERRKRKQMKEPLTSCKSGRDGECFHPNCPQIRDGEPEKSGRSCPLYDWHQDEY